MTTAAAAVPRAFIWRRVHSLMGLWLVLFLIEHLLTNSQAALWLGDNGQGFVDMVNAIHNFPYLQVIEIVLIGVPILIHGAWGIKYALTAKSNSSKGGDKAPYLPLPRSRAFTWQRITSWILLIGIILHVAKFRFLEYPDDVQMSGTKYYLVNVSMDPGLYTLADKLHVVLYDQQDIEQRKLEFAGRASEESLVDAAKILREQQVDPLTGPVPQEYSPQSAILLGSALKYESEKVFVQALEMQMVGPGHVAAVTEDFGTASLLAVRNTFKSPIYIALYTIFVIAACYHAGNGFWTFLITWGLILRMAAQRAWVTVSIVLIAALLFLGLMAVWGTYWMNLRY